MGFHMTAIEILNTVMQWVIAPVAAFVWLNYQKIQTHTTEIAVLKANANSLQQAHTSEMEQIRETSRAIMAKLDSIEIALRK
jgi:hypothetical protein